MLRAISDVIRFQTGNLLAVVRGEAQATGRSGQRGAEDGSQRDVHDIIGQGASAKLAACRAARLHAEICRIAGLAQVGDQDIGNQHVLQGGGDGLRAARRRSHEGLNVVGELARVVGRIVRVVDLVAIVGDGGEASFTAGRPRRSIDDRPSPRRWNRRSRRTRSGQAASPGPAKEPTRRNELVCTLFSPFALRCWWYTDADLAVGGSGQHAFRHFDDDGKHVQAGEKSIACPAGRNEAACGVSGSETAIPLSGVSRSGRILKN